MKYLFPILLIFILAGCSINSNPMGATTREQLRADAQVEVAKAQERAAIGVAEAEASAIVAKHSVWADVLPTALVIIGAIVIGALWLNWRGRYALAALERTPPAIVVQQPAIPTLGQLHQLAERQGMTISVRGDIAYLVDANGEVKGQRLLTS